MKTRRIRVRSLLAGCISCLRCVCVWTSGLTCRSSPFASPRHSSPLLPLRMWRARSVIYLLILLLLLLPARYPIPLRRAAERCVSQNRLWAYFSSYRSPSWVPLPSPLSPRWLHLFIAAAHCAQHRGSRRADAIPYPAKEGERNCAPIFFFDRYYFFKPKLCVPPPSFSGCRGSSRWRNECDGAVRGAEAEVASPGEGDLKLASSAREGKQQQQQQQQHRQQRLSSRSWCSGEKQKCSLLLWLDCCRWQN